MVTGATVDNYLSILGEDTANDRSSISSEDEEECRREFEDVTEIQDALVNDSSDSDNEVVRTNQLRRRPRQKKAHSSRNFGDFAVLLRRKYREDERGLTPTSRRLEIQSQVLRRDLRQLLEDENDGMNWASSPIRFESPFYTLFFHRHQIEAFTNGEAPSENRECMRLVHDFIHMDEGHKATLKQHDQYVRNGKIIFDILWTIYTPNSIFIHNINDIQQCVRCVGVPQLSTTRDGEKFYYVTVESLDFDGTHIGVKRQHISLEDFAGAKEISSLTLTPLEGHPRQSELESQMKSRFTQFRDLVQAGHSHKQSKCLAWAFSVENGMRKLEKAFQVSLLDPWGFNHFFSLQFMRAYRRCPYKKLGRC